MERLEQLGISTTELASSRKPTTAILPITVIGAGPGGGQAVQGIVKTVVIVHFFALAVFVATRTSVPLSVDTA